MVSVVASSAVDTRFETVELYYKIGICCFSAKHSALRIMGKDELAQDNMTLTHTQSGVTCPPTDCCFSESG